MITIISEVRTGTLGGRNSNNTATWLSRIHHESTRELPRRLGLSFLASASFFWLQWVELNSLKTSVSQTNRGKYGPTGGNNSEEVFQEGNCGFPSPEASKYTCLHGCATSTRAVCQLLRWLCGTCRTIAQIC